MKISSIVFDLDNTLYPESAYFKAIFEQFCNKHQWNIEKFDFLFEQFDHYRFNEKDIFGFALRSAQVYKDSYHEELFELFNHIDTLIQPYPHVDELITEALGKGIRLHVLTNGQSKAQTNKWKCLEISQKNRIFFSPSRDYGKDKPSSETFEKFVSEA